MSSSPTPITTPGTSLTPQPGAPTDIETARRREAEGDLEAAAQAYVATAASSPASRSEATLGAARMLLELERPADVRVLLEPFAASATGSDVAARYLLARSYAALGLFAESVQQYDLYIQSGRPALPYAYYDRAVVLLQIDQPLLAIASAQSGLEAGVPRALERMFILLVAQSYERANNVPQALVWYQRLLDESDSDDALASARIAELKRDQADASAGDSLRRLLAGYPGSPQALSELEAALLRDERIDATIRGLIYYRNHDYAKASPPFEEQLAIAPNDAASAIAYYYLAAIQESRGEIDTALANYSRSIAVNPASGLADDALWWRARIVEAQGKESEAATLLNRIVVEYPQSSWAPEAAFRRGMLAYGGKRYADAAAIWAEGLGRSPTASRSSVLASGRRRPCSRPGVSLTRSPSLSSSRLKARTITTASGRAASSRTATTCRKLRASPASTSVPASTGLKQRPG